MSSFDKIVKLACKPKAAAPKAKYIDPIIAATWSDDGAVSDVCKALVPRIREPNVIVVFKALIVLHMMIRNGSTDNVLGYLSQTDILRLRNVSAANWEGYAAPENLQAYAAYLESRIRAYRDLKHDAIRVQSDTNRDMRNGSLGDEDNHPRGGSGSTSKRGRSQNRDGGSSAPTRSKTILGRKLRVMTVEKGLLRETKIVHNMIDALVECRFYLDDLEDELNIEATRMLVKDLLILFQAGNEGVINVLEHYFEMSHIDATEALGIYRHFCKQTELVVEYLSVAKKLQNLLNVPIPNLKHAPVSLAGALQEYLDDPNFEENRLEYKENKKIAESDGRRSTPETKTKKASSVSFQEPPVPKLPSSATSSQTNGASTSNSKAETKDVIDFFAAIEQEQTSMFSPPNSAPLVQQHTVNPFSQMMTGQPFGQAPQISVQPTGFLVPQQTAFQAPAAPNPFNAMLGVQQQQQQPPGHRPFSAYLPAQGVQPQQPQMTGMPQPVQQPQQTGMLQQPQQTGFLQQPQQTMNFLQPMQTGFLQPQATGSNPFRQSMLMPQSTGTALFNNPSNANATSSGSPSPNNMFGQSSGAGSTPHSAGPFTASTTFASFSPQPVANSTSAFASLGGSSAAAPRQPDVPNRPQSTPLTSGPVQGLQPVKTHQTGTKNPFGPVITAPPPVPKVPTLMELAMGIQTGNNTTTNANSQQPTQTQNQQSTPSTLGSTTTGGFNFANSALNPGATDISSIASSFTNIGKNTATSSSSQSNTSSFNPLQPQHTVTPSIASSNGSSLFSSALSSQATGATSLSSGSSGMTFNPSSFSAGSPPGGAAAPLKSQVTGFAGLKPFKPSSSFGAALMDSLPPVTPSSPTSNTSPPAGGNPASIQPQHTVTPGSSLFASSMANNSSATPSNAPSNPTSPPVGALNSHQTGATGSFGSSMFSSTLGSRPNFSSTLNSQATGAPSGPFGAATNPTGAQQQSSLGVGLRPQMTGGGAANPFRASMANPGFGSGSPPPQIPALPTQFTVGGQQQRPFMAERDQGKHPSFTIDHHHHHPRLYKPLSVPVLHYNPFFTRYILESSKNSKMVAAPENTPKLSLEDAVEQAKRAFALQKYEQAVELYGTALEILTAKAGEDAPETADLYLSYGKALLENAIQQNGVLGKDQAGGEAPEEEESSKGPHRPILSFSGDGDDDPTIDLLNAPLEDDDDDEEEGQGEGEDDVGDPEDDFNAAWEVLELAKEIYKKQLQTDEDEEIQLKLADTFIALGDVSLETEKFDQAIEDYQSGLDLKIKLLPTSSRQIAEAHYKLSMVLDLTSGRLSDAIGHVEKALESVEHRLAELRSGLENQISPAPAPAAEEDKVDVKGKGKQVAKLVRDGLVQNMTKAQIEAEVKELSGLKDDLVLKIEEMKTSPAEATEGTAPELAAKALEAELNAGSSGTTPTVVNDLSGMVKKKKKPAPAAPAADAGASKRKADDSEEAAAPSPSEKKARLDDEKMETS